MWSAPSSVSILVLDASGTPRRWIGVVKEAIRTVAPRFCTRRMVKEYVERMYEPAMGLKR